jgi:hypothetical protein
MRTRNTVLGTLMAIALLAGSFVYGQKMNAPAENISGKKHPNLAAAQRLCYNAFEKITAAQEAHEWDLDGHAAKAKELLDQASNELKQAAISANKEHKQNQ